MSFCCLLLFILLILNFLYNNAVFKEIRKETFSTYIPGDIDMSVPPGQTISRVPLSKDCLLSKYAHSCLHAKKIPRQLHSHDSVYNYTPFDQIKNSYNEPSSLTVRGYRPEYANLTLPGSYPVRETRCDHLSMRECLNTPRCGWLTNRGGHFGRCLPGTPVGSLNPRHIPDAEDSIRKNITLDNWKYSYSPFVPQFFPSRKTDII